MIIQYEKETVMLENTIYKTKFEESQVDLIHINGSKSKQPWALHLKEITLHPDGGSMINQILGRRELVHYISFSWDFGGVNPTIYPNLNFKKNSLPYELNPGESQSLKDNSRILYPNKKVVESLNLCLVFFKIRKREETADVLLNRIERLISHSQLQRALVQASPSKLMESPLQLTHYAKVLQAEIETLIRDYKMKPLGTVNYVHRVKDETNYWGEETIFSDKIRIALVKERL